MLLTLEREPRQKRRWGQIVARAWDDDDYRKRLLAEPAAVLREEGIEVPPGIEVRVEEGEDVGDASCLRLPPRPGLEDLLDDERCSPLKSPVARGCTTCNCISCYCGRR
jgi:hypothetical protein